MTPAYLNAHQAAAYLGVGLRTIHKLRKSPDFPKPRNFGDRSTRWKLADLEAWADAQPCVDGRAEPAGLTRARGSRRGQTKGTPTPSTAEPRQSVASTSGKDFEPPAGSEIEPAEAAL